MDTETIKLKSWASGFIDGEGCFTIEKKMVRGSNIYYRPKLQVQLRADDCWAIENLRLAIGGGVVYQRKEQKATHNRGLSKPTTQCEWKNTEDLLLVIKHFDEYPLRAKKLRDYIIWRKAVIIFIEEKSQSIKQILLSKLKEECSIIKRYI